MKRWLAVFLLAATPASAETDLVAIDVLLQPDDVMLAEAQKWNARMREQTPEGFELDATHAPHITLLQTYVHADDLDLVLESVEKAAAGLNIDELEMEATGLYHIPSGEIGLQGIVVAPSPELLAVQDTIISVVEPFRRSGGGEAAFVPDPTGTPFDPYLFQYVDTFVPDQSGTNFNPHVSTGVAPLAWLEAREAETFDSFEFGAKGIAVYQLGNFGTAAARLSEF